MIWGAIFNRIKLSNDDPTSPHFKDTVKQWILAHPQAANLIGPNGKTPLMLPFSLNDLVLQTHL